MVGYLSKKPKLSFVDDPEKLYRQRRRATQAKGLETLDSKSRRTIGISKGITTSKSKGRSTSTATHGRQPQPERKIELCTLDIVDLTIIVTPVFPKKTKCITICMPGSSFMHIVTYKCI
jgi:hypothetical protein